MKDLPTVIPEGLVIAAICKREDPRDALVLRRDRQAKAAVDVATLPKGAIVGTSSPRRLAQLKHLRSDLVFKDLRGNVDTRLRKLDEGEYDALVLACAGLRRLGLESRISASLSTEQMLPAVGQGALAVEARVDDEDTMCDCRRTGSQIYAAGLPRRASFSAQPGWRLSVADCRLCGGAREAHQA